MRGGFIHCWGIALVLLLSGCAGKSSQQQVSDLWDTWEAYEQQVQADYPDAVPIVLIHGWNGGESTWPDPRTLMKMEAALQRDIYLFNYRTGIVANQYPPIEVLEEHLDIYLDTYQQVDVVAHSMGTLLMRQYLLHHRNNPVRRILLLSGPHFGSSVADFLVDLGTISLSSSGNIQAQEMLPGSDFLWDLNSADGSELEGKLALNVYAKAESKQFGGDAVVTPAHAWLPGALNAAIDGDHHLGQRINEPWAMRFLKDGTLPPLTLAPASRELWIRFKYADSAHGITFADGDIERFHLQHPHKKSALDQCCSLRSGLYSNGGTTYIVSDLQADDAIRLYFDHHTRQQIIPLAPYLQKQQPVQLITIMLERPGRLSNSGGS